MSQDVLANTQNELSIAPVTLADDGGGGSDGILDGSVVDRQNSHVGGVVLEAQFDVLDADITGGVLELIPLEGDLANGSDQAQVGTDKVTHTFVAITDKGILRYHYTGNKRYVSCRISNQLTGGAANNKAVVGGNVLMGKLRYAKGSPIA